MKNVITILIILLFIGSGVLVLIVNNQKDDIPTEIDKLTLGVESSLLPASVWIAEEMDYFREEGLDLTIEEFDSGKLSFSAMLDEEVDISTVAPTPIMFSSFDRQDFSIFATFAYAYEDIKVIARGDDGVDTAEDLKGKRIGTPYGTTGQFFVEAYLIHNGISFSEVEVIDISPSDLPSALENGQVDAIVIWEPHGHNATQLLGDKAVRLPSADIYKVRFNFMVMNAFAENNPDALVKFLKAIDKATIFVENNKDESVDIVSKRLNLERGSVSMFWDDFVFEISLEQSLILTLEDEARWAIRSNLTDATEVPNYLDYIYLDALNEVRPESVGIIR